MTTHYLTIPAVLDIELRHGITDEPMMKDGKPQTVSWAEMIRGVCFDPRMKAQAPGDGKLDMFEINELRLLARAKPGEVHQLSPKVKGLLVTCLTVPLSGEQSVVQPLYFTSGGAEHVRAIMDAPTVDPREASKANGKSSDVASA